MLFEEFESWVYFFLYVIVDEKKHVFLYFLFTEKQVILNTIISKNAGKSLHK